MAETATRPKWEYLVVDIHARHAEALQKELSEHGAEGWELIFMSEPIACEYRCVLRRPQA